MKAVVFDMDGVLVDSEPFHVDIEKSLFKKLNLNISEKEHSTYMGKATVDMWSEIISKYNLKLNIDEIVALNFFECEKYFSAMNKIDPMPGLLPVLEKLSRNKVPMSVASSSDVKTIQILLNRSGIEKYFQIKVSGSMVGKNKPEPDIFLYAAKLMNIQPEMCTVIEDSTNGIKAAKAAGMYCVAYAGSANENQDQTLADVQIYDYSELGKIFKNLGYNFS